jgi:signal transduction histidine kinase
VVGIFAAARDITERTKAQRALEVYQAELRALSLRLTLAEERARRELAIALHDTVGQTLALAKIKLGAMGEMLTARGHRKALSEIRSMFEEVVLQIRTLSFELSPPILYELGLGPALEWLGESFAKQHGFEVRFQGTGEAFEIGESARVLFFQSARELLTNIAKHAEATRVDVSLRTDDGRITMAIADNGKGMESEGSRNAAIKKSSIGLFSIRERMKHIGGSFEIQSSPGHGATMILTAPAWEAESTPTPATQGEKSIHGERKRTDED